jgi:hypothetical protein
MIHLIPHVYHDQRCILAIEVSPAQPERCIGTEFPSRYQPAEPAEAELVSTFPWALPETPENLLELVDDWYRRQERLHTADQGIPPLWYLTQHDVQWENSRVRYIPPGGRWQIQRIGRPEWNTLAADDLGGVLLTRDDLTHTGEDLDVPDIETWTKENPTYPGRYAWRLRAGCKPEWVYLVMVDGHLTCLPDGEPVRHCIGKWGVSK